MSAPFVYTPYVYGGLSECYTGYVNVVLYFSHKVNVKLTLCTFETVLCIRICMHRIRRTPWPRAPWWFSPQDRRRTCPGTSGSRRSRWCSTVQPGTAHTCLRSECNHTDTLRIQHINHMFQTIIYNSLFVALQNAPIRSTDTEVILSS